MSIKDKRIKYGIIILSLTSVALSLEAKLMGFDKQLKISSQTSFFSEESSVPLAFYNVLTEEQLNQFSAYMKKVIEFQNVNYQVVESQQGHFFIDRKDWIKKVLLKGQAWEPEIDALIRQYVIPGTIAIDIGAHIGTHTLALSSSVQDGIVLAFEPQTKLYEELVQNLQLNNCSNVISLYCALGEKFERGYLEPIRMDNEGYRRIVDCSQYSLNELTAVEIVPLDFFNLQSVSFLKIDAERYEKEVLEGAYRTIMENKPVIIIEIGAGSAALNLEENYTNFQSVMNLLEEMNYEVYPISLLTADYLALPK